MMEFESGNSCEIDKWLMLVYDRVNWDEQKSEGAEL